MGPVRDHRQCARAGLLPEQDDQGHARAQSASTTWPRHAPLRPHGRRRRPEGRDAAVRLATPASTSPARSLPIDGGVSAVIAPEGASWSSRSTSRSSSARLRAAALRARRLPRSPSPLRESSPTRGASRHGGVTMTLLDVVMAHAARDAGRRGVAETSGVVTIEMKTSFLRRGLGRLVGTRPSPAPHRIDRVLRRLAGRCRRESSSPTRPGRSSTERPAGGRQANPAPRTHPTERNRHGQLSIADPPRLAPDGEAGTENFRLVEAAARHAGRRPGAGAPSLPQPRPVHARPDERRQELRRAAAAGQGDAGRHGRRGRRIEASRYQPGDNVVGMGGWQEYSIVDAGMPGALRKVDTSRVPLSAYLGAVGMPGVTAWYGLMKICEPKPGETIVGQRRQRRGRQRRRPAREGARLPRRRHRRRHRQMRAT